MLKMIDFVISNYKGKPKYVIKKHGNRTLSSYEEQIVGKKASGFDIYIVLISLPSSYKSIKKINKII